MSCNNETFIAYYPGDNQPIKTTVSKSDGSRVENFQTSDLQEITFQAQDSTGAVIIEFTKTAGEIVVTEEDDQDIATIYPTVAKMSVPPDKYKIFMRLDLINTDRQYHVNMSQDGVSLTDLVILEGGIY